MEKYLLSNEKHNEQELGDALCWENIRDFVCYAFGLVSPADEYSYNWHIDCVSEHLHALYTGDLKRLIINIPPRSLKSINCTVAFPAWVLGRNPAARIITASYSQQLATKHSVDTRLIVESEWYKRIFPKTILTQDQNEKMNFMTTERGIRRATSVGGSITGDGGDIIIADDLMKPDEARDSTVVRESTLNWFDQTFMTRLNNPKTSRAMVVEQRLHAQDLTGHLLEVGGWHQVKIPAIAHKKVIIDINGRNWQMEEGQLMQEERLDHESLERYRAQLGDYAFAGQYLQEPVPASGAEFQVKWFNFYEKIVNYAALNLYMFVDPAGDKKKSTSDYTSIMVWALGVDKNYYLVDMIRDRLNTFERVDKIFSMQRKYSQLSNKPVRVFYKSRSFITELHSIKERMMRETYHFPFTEVIEKGEKNERIRRMILPAQQGRFFLPRYFNYIDYNGKPRDLTKEFLEQEIAMFPVASHDDMLDATSEMFNEKFSTEIMFPEYSNITKEQKTTSPRTWEEL